MPKVLVVDGLRIVRTGLRNLFADVGPAYVIIAAIQYGWSETESIDTVELDITLGTPRETEAALTPPL